jgi:hypothetical protein
MKLIMPSSEMLLPVPIVRADVSEELSVSIIRDPNSQILFILMIEALSSSETSILTRATRRHIPEDVIFIVTGMKT